MKLEELKCIENLGLANLSVYYLTPIHSRVSNTSIGFWSQKCYRKIPAVSVSELA